MKTRRMFIGVLALGLLLVLMVGLSTAQEAGLAAGPRLGDQRVWKRWWTVESPSRDI